MRCLGSHSVRPKMQIGGVGYFVGGRNAGELGELPLQRTSVQTFRVTGDARLQRGVDEHFDEPQPVLLVSKPGLAAVVGVGTDDRAPGK